MEYTTINQRFPSTDFTVSCFATAGEIHTKQLSEKSTIIIRDMYMILAPDPANLGGYITETKYQDFYVVNQKPDRSGGGVYYEDVVDEILSRGFSRRLGGTACIHDFVKIADDPNMCEGSSDIYTIVWV